MYRSCLFALVLGCSSNASSTSQPDTGGTPECVAYDGVMSDGNLPFDDSTASTISPTCAPRCGIGGTGGFYRPAALPSGACTNEPACDMAARLECCNGGPVNGYHCTCESGKWRCVIESQGGSVCDNSCLDAGGGGG